MNKKKFFILILTICFKTKSSIKKYSLLPEKQQQKDPFKKYLENAQKHVPLLKEAFEEFLTNENKKRILNKLNNSEKSYEYFKNFFQLTESE